mgnify:FL=1
MKKIILSFFVAALLFSCGGKKKAINDLTLRTDSLQYVINNRDSIINDALVSLSDISATLNDIKRQEGIVVNNAELGKADKEQIREDLEAIAALLKEKRQALARLEKSSALLKEANVNIEGLQKLVEELTKQVEERDQTIAVMLGNIDDLKAEVEKLNLDIEAANEVNAKISSDLEQTTNDLNTAYYIVGTEKSLIQEGILVKRGTVNRTLVLNPEMDLSKLTKIDIRSVDRIEVKGKRAEVIGGFPVSSYTLEEGENDRKFVDALLINDKDAFWRNGKVLVIAYR